MSLKTNAYNHAVQRPAGRFALQLRIAGNLSQQPRALFARGR